MTVIDVMVNCVQRINGIRLPVAEAGNMLQLAEIANDIQACINTLVTHANDGAKPAEDADGEVQTESIEGADEQKAGEDDDKRQDV